jgi:hypothetical protein
MKRAWLLPMATLALPAAAAAQRNAPPSAPYILEHSYWLQPGETEHFIELFNRNKLPLLKREITDHRIRWMRITRPRLRSGDVAQPDVRLTIAWASPNIAFDDMDPSRFAAALYKDPALREREEQTREKLILRRSDMPVQELLIDRE